MEIDFLKMQGCGDDVILVDAAKNHSGLAESVGRLTRGMLDRSRGVGGNSLLYLGRGDRDRLDLRGFTADGEQSVVSANALRCAARYGSDSGAVTVDEFTIETAGGPVKAQIIDSVNVRVDMGMPLSRETQAEIREMSRESFTRSILVEGRSVSYTPISLGRSYALLFVPDFSFPVNRTARRIAAQPDFPSETGIGFVQIFNREEMRLRVWEGGEKYPGDECACAAAALVASVVNGFADREAFVHLRRGDIFLQWEEGENRIWLTGPAQYVFSGIYEFEEKQGERPS